MRAPTDLRSDTMTRPTPAMREAMARAEVGDDVWGEDPTVRRLEEETAALLGKEAALFVPSGTMSNQLALLLHTRRGDEVIVGQGAHMEGDESGAAAAWSGVQMSFAGQGGFFGRADVEAARKPEGDWHCARTSLIAVENTHNRSGGRIWPADTIVEVAAYAREKGLPLHLDGARLWNAAVASGAPEAALAAPFDTLSVCFSKGLGAPVGSALVGPKPLIQAAIRLRKMLGGGMRQAGILAAGALHALAHHRARLADDHAAAREFAAQLAGVPGVRVVPAETNIVVVETPTFLAERAVERAAPRGVLLSTMGRHLLRAVLHLDVPADDAAPAGRVTAEVLAELEREARP
jgi:threonine aldolase